VEGKAPQQKAPGLLRALRRGGSTSDRGERSRKYGVGSKSKEREPNHFSVKGKAPRKAPEQPSLHTPLSDRQMQHSPALYSPSHDSLAPALVLHGPYRFVFADSVRSSPPALPLKVDPHLPWRSPPRVARLPGTTLGRRRPRGFRHSQLGRGSSASRRRHTCCPRVLWVVGT
jgi:hypothetical protein